MGLLAKSTSFGALLLCASPFMEDLEVQRLQFHYRLYEPSVHVEKIL